MNVINEVTRLLIKNTVFYALFFAGCLFAINSHATEKQSYSIAINETSYPYHFINNADEPAGLMVDMWRLWAEKQQVQVSFIPLPWEETLRRVGEGNIDLHAGLAKSDLRAQTFDFTSTFFPQNSYLFIHRNLTGINTLEQLAPYTVGVVKGSNHVAQLQQRLPNIRIRTYPSRHDLYHAALAGEILAFTALDRLSQNFSEYDALSSLFPAHKKILYREGEYAAALAKNNTQLLEFVEQGFAKISSDERVTIERKWLGLKKGKDTIIAAIDPDLAPFMGISATGVPYGLFVDIWHLWSDASGIKVKFVTANIVDAQQTLAQGVADVYVAYPKIDNVIPQVSYSEINYRVKARAYVSNRMLDISSLDDLRNETIGVYYFSPYIDALKTQYPEINIRMFRDFDELIHAAENLEVKAIVAEMESMNHRLMQSGLRTSFHVLPKPVFNLPVQSLITSSNEKLGELISYGFSKISKEKLLALEEKWLSFKSEGYFQEQSTLVSLTQEELAWAKMHSNVKIGTNVNWKPLEYFDSNGEVLGINPSVIKLIEQRVPLTFEHVPFRSWQAQFSALVNGEIDILASATQTEERDKYLLFSDSYWDMPWVVIHQRQLGSQLKLSDFYGKSLAIIKGYYLVGQIQKEHPNIALMLVDDYQEGVQALQQGLVDGVVENIATASEIVRQESLITLGMSVVDEFNVDQNRFATKKDRTMLVGIINKALATISATEKQQIYEEWFEINVETGLDKNVVLRVAVQGVAITLIIIAVIIVWNRRLQVEIRTRKALEEQMKHMATHDELTGLANRILLKDRLTTAINFHKRQELLIAVMFIDLDGFKQVNDTFGHDVGDELLKLVATRLDSCVRVSDTIVRFGGDEFVILLTGLHNKNEAAYVANKILNLVQQPFELSTGFANIGCSIGIAIYPEDGETDSDLLKVADTLMYQVKAEGKNHYTFYS
ncbi:transporter substrate-binding domain-containing protein [Thalassotalea fusca]